MISLITGGARSGKSTIAETITLRHGTPAHYIATAEARDAEMTARIAEHQARRGPEWISHAAPFDLLGALRDTDAAGPRLVDCLTLWLTNLILDNRDWRAEALALVAGVGLLLSVVVTLRWTACARPSAKGLFR